MLENMGRLEELHAKNALKRTTRVVNFRGNFFYRGRIELGQRHFSSLWNLCSEFTWKFGQTWVKGLCKKDMLLIAWLEFPVWHNFLIQSARPRRCWFGDHFEVSSGWFGLYQPQRLTGSPFSRLLQNGQSGDHRRRRRRTQMPTASHALACKSAISWFRLDKVIGRDCCARPARGRAPCPPTALWARKPSDCVTPGARASPTKTQLTGHSLSRKARITNLCSRSGLTSSNFFVIGMGLGGVRVCAGRGLQPIVSWCGFLLLLQVDRTGCGVAGVADDGGRPRAHRRQAQRICQPRRRWTAPIALPPMRADSKRAFQLIEEAAAPGSGAYIVSQCPEQVLANIYASSHGLTDQRRRRRRRSAESARHLAGFRLRHSVPVPIASPHRPGPVCGASIDAVPNKGDGPHTCCAAGPSAATLPSGITWPQCRRC